VTGIGIDVLVSPSVNIDTSVGSEVIIIFQFNKVVFNSAPSLSAPVIIIPADSKYQLLTTGQYSYY
jgi:hypothetical protein